MVINDVVASHMYGRRPGGGGGVGWGQLLFVLPMATLCLTIRLLLEDK